MPVPFEALIPLGLITGFFGVSGILFQKLKTSVNEGQVPFNNNNNNNSASARQRNSYLKPDTVEHNTGGSGKEIKSVQDIVLTSQKKTR